MEKASSLTSNLCLGHVQYPWCIGSLPARPDVSWDCLRRGRTERSALSNVSIRSGSDRAAPRLRPGFVLVERPSAALILLMVARRSPPSTIEGDGGAFPPHAPLATASIESGFDRVFCSSGPSAALILSGRRTRRRPSCDEGLAEPPLELPHTASSSYLLPSLRKGTTVLASLAG